MLCDKYKQNKGYLNDVEKNKTKSTIRKFFRSLFISSDQLNNYLQINCDDEEMKKKKKKNSRKKPYQSTIRVDLFGSTLP